MGGAGGAGILPHRAMAAMVTGGTGVVGGAGGNAAGGGLANFGSVTFSGKPSTFSGNTAIGSSGGTGRRGRRWPMAVQAATAFLAECTAAMVVIPTKATPARAEHGGNSFGGGIDNGIGAFLVSTVAMTFTWKSRSSPAAAGPEADAQLRLRIRRPGGSGGPVRLRSGGRRLRPGRYRRRGRRGRQRLRWRSFQQRDCHNGSAAQIQGDDHQLLHGESGRWGA